MSLTAKRSLFLAALAALMAATRMDHFAALPDGSWAVFFIGGFYLSTWTRWAFPALMALAVLIDYVVISRSGASFWAHYCVSPAYWCLIPAYFSMWAGGMWLQRRNPGTDLRALSLLAVGLCASVALCQFVSQGSFYWFSGSVADPTLAGWWKNYTDWLPSYLLTAAAYTGAAAAVHALAAQASRVRRAGHLQAS